MNNNLGKILRERRIAKGLRLKDVSKLSGVHISHLGRVERGERFPSARILIELSEPLGFGKVEIMKVAGLLSGDETDNRMEMLKKEIKLAVAEALAKILERIDKL